MIQIKKICWHCSKALVLTFFVSTLLLMALLWWLSKAPVSVDRFLPTIESLLSENGLPVTFSHLRVGYSYGLLFEGEGVKLSNKQGEQALLIHKISLRLSNRSLLKGVIAPKEVVVTGVSLHADIEGQEINLGEGIRSLAFGLEEVSENEHVTGIVEFLNRWDTIENLEKLHTLRLRDLDIDVIDHDQNKTWSFNQAAIDFTRSNVSEILSLTGVLKQSDQHVVVPVLMKATHLLRAPDLEARISLKDTDTDLIKEYLPQSFQKFVKSQGKISFGVTVGLKNKILQPWFELNLKNIQLWPESAYNNPLMFSTLQMRGRYTKEKDQLHIEQLILSDASGLNIFIQGVIDNLEKDPEFDLSVTAEPSTLKQLNTYVPDKILGGTVDWLENRLFGTQIKNFYGTYKGKPSAFPYCKNDCGIYIKFDFTDLAVQFLDEMSSAKEVSGVFEMTDEGIIITAPEGILNQQKVRDITVKIEDLFEKTESILTVEANFQGTFSGVLKELKKEWPEIGLIRKAQGEHITKLRVVLPLQEEELSLSAIDIYAETDISRLTVNEVEGLEGLTFEASLAALSVQKGKINFEADGYLNNMFVNFKWQENIATFGQKTRVDIQGDIPADIVAPYLEEYGLTVKGVVPSIFTLKTVEDKVFDYELSSQLEKSYVYLPKLNWEKLVDETLQLKSRGRIDIQGKDPIFDVELLMLTGKNTEVLGSLYYNPAKLEKTAVQLMPFKIGRNDASVSIADAVLKLKGKVLDLSSFNLFKKEGHSKTYLKSIQVDVDKIWFEGGLMRFVKGKSFAKNGAWYSYDFSAFTGENDVFNLTMKELNNNKRNLYIYADNAGQALKILGLFDKMRQGNLEASLLVDSMGDSVGTLLIKDVRLIDAPVLVRLLSLLSLEQLLTSGKGIFFNEATIPLEILGEKVRIRKASLSGPSIGLRFDGKYNTDTKNLKFKGQLIPIEGLNQIISRIPIIGNILTGSQEGVVVADFKVTGTAKEPKVSVNPLSVVTPGILKDFFGVLTGSNKDDD